MLDRNQLFLLTGRPTSRRQSVYTGISITDETHDLDDDEVWKARIISNPPVRADLVKHQVTCAHLRTSEDPRWEQDGIISKASDRESDPARRRKNEVLIIRHRFDGAASQAAAESEMAEASCDQPRFHCARLPRAG